MPTPQQIAADPRTQESQRRHRIEGAVQEIMRNLQMTGVHSGTVIDDGCLETIAGALRAAISKAERGAYLPT
jgi:hypothetical protein